MVSIFADNVFSDTQTVQFDDGERVDSELNSKLSFATQNIDSILSGFTYVETAIMTLDFDPILDNEDIANFKDMTINVKPSIEFNATLDLFADVNAEQIAKITGSPFGGEQSVSFAIDKYVDTPAVAGYEFTTGGDDPQDILVVGNQTIDITGTIQLIGRKP